MGLGSLLDAIPTYSLPLGHQLKAYKEMAARMEKLPSQLVIHKHTNGTDANWAALWTPFLVAPFQHVFGAPNYGTYQQAPGQPWAFERIEDLWQDILPKVVDDNYVGDHSHAIAPPPEAATKKVRFTDAPQPSANPDQPIPETAPDMDDVTESDTHSLLPAVSNPLKDSQPAQPPTNSTPITPSPPKKARLYRDVDDALGF